MNRLLVVATIVVALSGCSFLHTAEKSIVPSKGDATIVRVPVPVTPPAPPVTNRPALAIDTLDAGDEKNPAKVAKAYKATVMALEGYSIQLETTLDAYRTTKKKPAVVLPTIEEVPRTALPASDAAPASDPQPASGSDE